MADTSPQFHDPESLSYLSQADATAVDEALRGSLGFSVDQLMELTGLSVASAIAEVYGAQDYSRVLVIAGPGNNGGDGLVAARHLHHFGYKITVCYPKRTNKPLYQGLVTQLECLAIPFLSDTGLPCHLADDFHIIVDAMFGFSFKGTPRPPFDAFLQRLIAPSGSKAADLRVSTLVSIDIPSGWHVEEGDIEGTGLVPDMLVSLTAPKICAKSFKGAHHFLGGRFVPPAVVLKFGLQLPSFPGTSQCVRIGKPPSLDVTALRVNYSGSVLLQENAKVHLIKQSNIASSSGTAPGGTNGASSSGMGPGCNNGASSSGTTPAGPRSAEELDFSIHLDEEPWLPNFLRDADPPFIGPRELTDEQVLSGKWPMTAAQERWREDFITREAMSIEDRIAATADDQHVIRWPIKPKIGVPRLIRNGSI